MLARILDEAKISVSTDGPEILAAIKSGKLTWVELERQTPRPTRYWSRSSSIR